jgi:hypothetical protein
MPTIRIKRGSALQLTLAAVNADGSAFDWTSVTTSCEVRDPRNALVDQLTLVPSDTAGVATIIEPDTIAWPEGLLKCDVLIMAAGLATHTETFGITVRGCVTYSQPAMPDYNPITDQAAYAALDNQPDDGLAVDP